MEASLFPNPDAWIIVECLDGTYITARYRIFPTTFGLPPGRQGRWEIYVWEIKCEFLRVPHLV